MNELVRALVGDSAAAPPSHILEGIDRHLVDAMVVGAPHTIYEELWHVTFWQQISLDWFAGRETPVPEHASGGFPTAQDRAGESWDALCSRFFVGLEQAAVVAGDEAGLDATIRCPSPAGKPVRVMTVRDQTISLVAHNTYHLGRVVLLRQMLGSWPPASGGFTW
ncbi:DinB superfamily protein [Granulicella pectinivorans]|uniref:DinB superfamily protein n=1 Tax=Granulicella pectinivorans TaxID=474950 RepID=A0A1I6LVE0_9BACT|nr:DinB family protein [Granulicella pectinivorans]SFS07384.1 DinB superfamily protein [Granulicella pectinivorans]